MTTVVDEFSAAYAAVQSSQPGLGEEDQLTHRLAVACTEVLPVSAAAISVFSSDGIRIPLGASTALAVLAERLEFTVGDGPSLHAQRTAQVVRAPEAVLALQWPSLYRMLIPRTRFRSVTSIPLTAGANGFGSLDLYFARSRDLSVADLVRAVGVSLRITTILVRANLVPLEQLHQRFLTSRPVTSRNWVFVATDQVRANGGGTAQQALDAIRRHATATDRTVDDVACDIVTGRLRMAKLTSSGKQDLYRRRRASSN